MWGLLIWVFLLGFTRGTAIRPLCIWEEYWAIALIAAFQCNYSLFVYITKFNSMITYLQYNLNRESEHVRSHILQSKLFKYFFIFNFCRVFSRYFDFEMKRWDKNKRVFDARQVRKISMFVNEVIIKVARYFILYILRGSAGIVGKF